MTELEFIINGKEQIREVHVYEHILYTGSLS
jgi:hypothetical protein